MMRGEVQASYRQDCRFFTALLLFFSRMDTGRGDLVGICRLQA